MMEQEIRQLAGKFGITLKGPLRFNELGLDYQVIFAEDESGQRWVLRKPRREDLAEQIQREARILQFLKTHLKFEIPDWKFASTELIAYPMLKDPPALLVDTATYDLTWNIEVGSESFTRSFAKAVFQLHQIPTEQAIAAGLPGGDIQSVRSQLRSEIQTVKRELGVSERLEQRWQAWLADDSYWPQNSSVIHGDLYAGHTMVSPSEEVTGMIDWSEAAVGDPTTDLVGHYVAFGEPALDQLLKFYLEAGGQVWPRIKEHIIERSSITALKYGIFALKTQNAEQLQEARRHLLE